MRKAALLLTALLAAGGLALANGDTVREFTVGDTAIGWFTNLTGDTVTGFHLEFDGPVTLAYVVTVGGVVENVSGTMEGVSFDFVGELVPYGMVEIDWQPTTAKVALFQWLSGGRSVGKPYFATLPAFLKVLVNGLVALREQSPDQFQALLQGFFAANPDLQGTLAEAGIPPEMLVASLMTAPPEGILNLLTTMVEGFGIQTLPEFLQALDLTPLLQALGM